MYDDFGVGRRLKDMPVPFVLAAKQRRVDQVSVMRHGHGPERKLPQQRLSVAKFARSGGRIAHVTDRCRASQVFFQHSRVEIWLTRPMPVWPLSSEPFETAI